MTSKKWTKPAEKNYNLQDIAAGAVLTNKNGNRKIRVVRSFIRNTTKTIVVYSVLNKSNQIDYNDQKTFEQLSRSFPVMKEVA